MRQRARRSAQPLGVMSDDRARADLLHSVLPQFFPAHWLADAPDIVAMDFPSRIRIGYVMRGDGGYSYVTRPQMESAEKTISRLLEFSFPMCSAYSRSSLDPNTSLLSRVVTGSYAGAGTRRMSGGLGISPLRNRPLWTTSTIFHPTSFFSRAASFRFISIKAMTPNTALEPKREG